MVTIYFSIFIGGLSLGIAIGYSIWACSKNKTTLHKAYKTKIDHTKIIDNAIKQQKRSN